MEEKTGKASQIYGHVAWNVRNTGQRSKMFHQLQAPTASKFNVFNGIVVVINLV